ncbi:hypothetical protein GJAV_G00195320 [Gymnothorax javanicus]|nr:hypothetical protein GJAV_G00195320 [Gymnothorax javanicus]
MASRPALESGNAPGLMGEMSQPIRMMRRSLSYDDSLNTPMASPPSDPSFNVLWKRPVAPTKKSRHLSEEDEFGGPLTFKVLPANPAVPVVKAKASSSMLNSIMNRQSQDSIQRFEQQAGLRDNRYSPHKGLTAEETRYHCVTEALDKLKMPSGDFGEEKQRTSAQSTPSVTPSVTPSATPQASPKINRRSWFGQGSVAFIPIAEFDSGDAISLMGGTEGGGGDNWSLFGMRSAVSKSSTDPESLALQSCPGSQKANPLDLLKTKVPPDPVLLKTPKIEITGLEVKKQMPRPHRLKPRDMNVLTPSGF